MIHYTTMNHYTGYGQKFLIQVANPRLTQADFSKCRGPVREGKVSDLKVVSCLALEGQSRTWMEAALWGLGAGHRVRVPKSFTYSIKHTPEKGIKTSF